MKGIDSKIKMLEEKIEKAQAIKEVYDTIEIAMESNCMKWTEDINEETGRNVYIDYTKDYWNYENANRMKEVYEDVLKFLEKMV